MVEAPLKAKIKLSLSLFSICKALPNPPAAKANQHHIAGVKQLVIYNSRANSVKHGFIISSFI